MDAPKSYLLTPMCPEERYRPVPVAPPVVSGPVQVPREIRCESISIVVPVKDNQAGIDRFLASVASSLDLAGRPREIIIVDNGSGERTEQRVECAVPVRILDCKRRGPGAARNVGVAHAAGDWILFTDSDCLATPSLVSAYTRDDNEAVGYAGLVDIQVVDEYTRFYALERSFLPVALETGTGVVPATLITANCLVLKAAFQAIGGFNEDFVYAAGEDMDLGFRLRLIGGLRFRLDSVAGHEMAEGMSAFMERFVRYGRGHALLAKHYVNAGLFEFRPPTRMRATKEQQFLAEVSYRCMIWGFRAERSDLLR